MEAIGKRSNPISTQEETLQIILLPLNILALRISKNKLTMDWFFEIALSFTDW